MELNLRKCGREAAWYKKLSLTGLIDLKEEVTKNRKEYLAIEG